MIGGRNSSQRLQLAGLVFCLIAVVGSVVYGWEFGGDTGPVPTVLGIVAVALALVVTVRRRR